MAHLLAKSVRSTIASRGITSNETMAGYIINAMTQEHGENMKADMLTVNEFIRAAKFPVEAMDVDRFYNNLKHDMPIFIDDAVIEWMGFDGGAKNEMRFKRPKFMQCLRACDPHNEYHQEFSFVDLGKWRDELLVQINVTASSNVDNATDLSSESTRTQAESSEESDDPHHIPLPGLSQLELEAMYPEIAEDRYTKQRKFVTVDPDLFQVMLMKLGTSKGVEIRNHFVACKKLLDVYMMYQSVYKHLEMQIDMDNMQRKMDKMLIKMDDTNNKLDESNAKLDESNAKLDISNNKLDEATKERNNLSDKLDEAHDERDELKSEIVDFSDHVGELNDNVEDLNARIVAASPDHIHKPAHASLTHELILYGNDQRKYKCLRTQRRSSAKAIKRVIDAGYTRHVLTIPYAQGSINMWNLLRSTYRGAIFCASTCTLKRDVTESELIGAISTINSERVAI
jgi:hypothetical protein